MNHIVSHLKVFGCVTYSNVLGELLLRNKLDKKGHKCIFVGYSEDIKEYKLYDPIVRKVIISHNVQLVENESWDGTIKNNVNIVSNVEHDDMKEEVVQTPHAIKPVTTLMNPMTP